MLQFGRLKLDKSVWVMAGKIIIDIERCKGCGLCVAACPKGCIVSSKHSNTNGYFPAEKNDIECTGCAICAVICPEAIIEVRCESKIVAIEPTKKSKADLIREKA